MPLCTAAITWCRAQPDRAMGALEPRVQADVSLRRDEAGERGSDVGRMDRDDVSLLDAAVADMDKLVCLAAAHRLSLLGGAGDVRDRTCRAVCDISACALPKDAADRLRADDPSSGR